MDAAEVTSIADRAAARVAGRADGLWHDDVIQAARIAAFAAGDEPGRVYMKARAAAIYELRTVTQARHRHGSTVAVLDALPHDPPFRDGEAPDLSRVTGAERRALWAVATHRTHAEAARALGVSAGRVSQLVRSAIDHAA